MEPKDSPAQVLRGDIATGIGRVGSLNSGYQIPSKFFAEVLCDVFGIFVAVISTVICRSHNDAGLTDSLINHVIQNGNCVRERFKPPVFIDSAAMKQI